MIADGFFGGSNPDTLYTVDPTTGVKTTVGPTGTLSIESMALDPVNNIIYACSGDSVGTINPVSGAFTIILEARLIMLMVQLASIIFMTLMA